MKENQDQPRKGNALFSFRNLYPENTLARMSEKALLALLAILILTVPLPFGSVSPFWLLSLEAGSALVFLIWFMRLMFLSDKKQLELFYKAQKTQGENARKLPLFSRRPYLAEVFRVLTLGRWPRKNPAENIVEESLLNHSNQTDYFSLFRYPLRNSGLEKIGLAFLALVSLQLIPLPRPIMMFLSPAGAKYYETAAGLAGVQRSAFPISLNPYDTFSKLLEYCCYFMIYLVVVNTVARRSHRRFILISLLISATFQASYGFYEFLSGHQHIFGFKKKIDTDCVTGSFINHNHFAAYLELSIPIMIGFWTIGIKAVRISGNSISARISSALEDQGAKALLKTLLLILLGMGLLFSISRSGILFGFISCTTFFVLYLRRSRSKIPAFYWISSLGVMIVLAAWIGLRPLIQDFMNVPEELTEEISRPVVWKDTFIIFLKFTLTGSGFGTFKEVFPAFRSFSTNTVYSQAHNDYLQLLAEGGIFMLILILAGGLTILKRLRRVLSERMGETAVIHFACFSSLLAIALHSISDFSLQIPAIAVSTAVVAAIYFSNARGEYYAL